MRSRLPFAALLLVMAVPTDGAAQASVPIDEWPVPWERTRPRDPYVAPDGRIVFVGQTGDYVGILDPATGDIRRLELEAGTGPHNVIVAADGYAWYAGNRAAHIGRMDLRTGQITRFPMPDPEARDPHTLVFDQAGDIWFTVQGGNFVGKLATRSGDVRLVKMTVAGSRPYGIVVDRSNRPWFVLFGTNRIGTVDPATFELKEFQLPDPRARPRRLALSSDGAVWYGDYSRGMTGRLDTRTGEVREWPNPGGAMSLPYAVTMDDRDVFWYVETGPQPNMLVGFHTGRGQVISRTPVPSGGGTVRHMVFDPKEGVIWFGTDANTVGRAAVRRPTALPPNP